MGGGGGLEGTVLQSFDRSLSVPPKECNVRPPNKLAPKVMHRFLPLTLLI